MEVIVTLGGSGKRFSDAGYSVPKPYIEAGGKELIRHIIDIFDAENDNFHFALNTKHIDYRQLVESLVKKSKTFLIPQHKKGPVYSVMQYPLSSTFGKETIVTYCDNPYKWDYEDFKKYVKDNDLDGCIISHKGWHPHRLASTFMAYMRMDGDNVAEVQEKKPFTDNHWEENASIGTYYFKDGAMVQRYFKQCLDENLNYNNEFYVTLVYNLMIRDGLKVGVYDVEKNAVLGTPSELENFNAWAKIIEGSQCKTKDDAAKCFEYWKNYHGKN